MRNAQAHKLQWSGPTVHSSTVAISNEALSVNGFKWYMKCGLVSAFPIRDKSLDLF